MLHVVPPGDFHGSISDTGAPRRCPETRPPIGQKHAALQKIGVDGWWPDEGDKFSVYARFDAIACTLKARARRVLTGGRSRFTAMAMPACSASAGSGPATRSAPGARCARRSWWASAPALSGIPYWGTDIGGFVPTPELTPELFLRWFQWARSARCFAGTAAPGSCGCRGDGTRATPGQKKWTAIGLRRGRLQQICIGAEVEEICRKYLNLRYQLLPYLYSSLLRKATQQECR